MHKREGTIKRGVQLSYGEFGCYYYCHLGVQAHKATDPLPWLSQCPSSRKHTLEVQCCLFLPIACIMTYLEDFELL